MFTVYLKNWKSTMWWTGLTIKNLRSSTLDYHTSNRTLRVIFAAKLSVNMANTNNRASDFLQRNYLSSDVLLMPNLPKDQAYVYTHN